jgi:choline kinase
VNSDVLFEDEIARRLVSLDGSALLCDGSHGIDQESMKVVSRGGRLTGLSKDVPVDSNPEYVGLARIDPAHGPLLARILEQLVSQDTVQGYYEAGIEQLAALEPVRVVRIDGLAWIEIDDPDDLSRAQGEVLERVA